MNRRSVCEQHCCQILYPVISKLRKSILQGSVSSLNHSVCGRMVGRNLHSANSPTIEKPKHFFLELPTSVNYHSPKDSMSTDDIFPDKHCNCLCLFVCNSPGLNPAAHVISGNHQVFLPFSCWHISDVNCPFLHQPIGSCRVHGLLFSSCSSELAFFT